MSDGSTIEWTDATWNVVTGCTKVSAGCKHCYAERIFPRPYPGRDFGDVRFHEDRLTQPLRWSRPRRVFVNSLSDLFHEAIADEVIDQVFAVMAMAEQHTFQVLTKRPDRMRRYFAAKTREQTVWVDRRAAGGGVERVETVVTLPLPNVWLGVSVEDRETTNQRVPVLLHTPAAVRFVSAEPLLEELPDLGVWLSLKANAAGEVAPEHDVRGYTRPGIGWVIVGGESGPGARLCDVAWIRSIMRQCRATGVPVFVKQLGAKPKTAFAVRGKGGDPAEWPEDLRVREFPAAPAEAAA